MHGENSQLLNDAEIMVINMYGKIKLNGRKGRKKRKGKGNISVYAIKVNYHELK